MPLRLYNTLAHAIEDFVAGDPTRVTFYSCGPTVYDDAHIGNFRSFLAADVLRRWLESAWCVVRDAMGHEHAGPRRVDHVMNITDVGHMTDDDQADGGGEDKMQAAGRRIAEAKKAGKLPAGVEVDPSDPYAVARFYEGRFREDARALGLKVDIDAEKDPTRMPRATENVPGMIEVIARLVERHSAYVVGEPGQRVVYFDVRSFPAYGRLSGNTLENLREGEGGRISAQNQATKRHPADFLLWKEDASHLMKWQSPWGEGYPGWHIECTAMSVSRLLHQGDATSAGVTKSPLIHGGTLIDLHSGGEDNIFPHHECEIAQSCAAFCSDAHHGSFARHWFHARFLQVEGAKMSKSKGNFFTPRDLFARGVEASALRLELIRTHYRTNANFTLQGLEDSARMIERWRKVASGDGSDSANAATAREQCKAAFIQAMHDDLNIAGAIGAVNTWVGTIATPSTSDAAFMRELDAVLGVLSLERAKATTSEIGAFLPGVTPDPKVEALLLRRRDARQAKDYKASDAIRDELLALGYTIKDVAGGKVEVGRALK
ncbi:MAG: cysteine--tRNA ligase [Phycisphaerales bacterium]